MVANERQRLYWYFQRVVLKSLEDEERSEEVEDASTMESPGRSNLPGRHS
jgi:hypothetical protein